MRKILGNREVLKKVKLSHLMILPLQHETEREIDPVNPVKSRTEDIAKKAEMASSFIQKQYSRY